jgi:glucose-6-phosphate isomerase
VEVVTIGDLAAATQAVIEELTGAGVPGRLTSHDATLWGEESVAEAGIRLGWLDLPDSSRQLLARLDALRAELLAEGLDHVVLAGMGGSSLAPEVITRSAGVPLTVLDTTDPGQIRAALGDRLDRTVVVVSSKSGGTVETDSHRRAYARALADAGLSGAEVGRRFVVVTDPGSSLERAAGEFGARAVFLADPHVGGRYSALSAFGLVPSALAGVDVAALLADARQVAGQLGKDDANPGLRLGAALGAAWRAGRDKIAISTTGPAVAGFGDWAEQLLAESTGKLGRGVLPVVLEEPSAPGGSGADVASVVVGAAGSTADGGHGPAAAMVTVTGPLGAQFLVWEYATAVAGRVIGINPFDQPNVAESKQNTNQFLGAFRPGPRRSPTARSTGTATPACSPGSVT